MCVPLLAQRPADPRATTVVVTPAEGGQE